MHGQTTTNSEQLQRTEEKKRKAEKREENGSGNGCGKWKSECEGDKRQPTTAWTNTCTYNLYTPS